MISFPYTLHPTPLPTTIGLRTISTIQGNVSIIFFRRTQKYPFNLLLERPHLKGANEWVLV
ncbi:MAG: hypothetical protein F6J93_26615 [Oscillatoria sp. SIO1A7]|nr:hypothetical protein [Oscillatoria sp. SIO1A7]